MADPKCPAGVRVRGLERYPRGGEPIEVIPYDGGRIPLEDGSVDESGDPIVFALADGGEPIRVEYSGKLPQLFAPGIPVVCEGTFPASTGPFQCDLIMIRHDNQYSPPSSAAAEAQ